MEVIVIVGSEISVYAPPQIYDENFINKPTNALMITYIVY
jgi:hypothetical protein